MAGSDFTSVMSLSFLDVCSLGLDQFPYRLFAVETDVDLDSEQAENTQINILHQ